MYILALNYRQQTRNIIIALYLFLLLFIKAKFDMNIIHSLKKKKEKVNLLCMLVLRSEGDMDPLPDGKGGLPADSDNVRVFPLERSAPFAEGGKFRSGDVIKGCVEANNDRVSVLFVVDVDFLNVSYCIDHAFQLELLDTILDHFQALTGFGRFSGHVFADFLGLAIFEKEYC